MRHDMRHYDPCRALTVYMAVCIAVLAMLVPAPATASLLPVFRYALERWDPDTYELLVVYRDGLNAEEQAAADWLEKNSRSQLPAANYTVRMIDVDSGGALDIPAIAGSRDDDSLPFFALLPPPGGIRPQHIICRGPLTFETAKTLVDSPMRREMADRLTGGDSVVWVLVESGNTLRDAEAIRTLEAGIDAIQRRHVDRQPDTSGAVATIQDMPVAYSWITLRRYDPLETYTISMLLDGASEEPDPDNPLVVPVYGRGRALNVYRGDTLTETAIGDVATYLTAPCTDETKDRYAGYDLLMPVDWNSRITSNWVFLRDSETVSNVSRLRSLFIPFSPVSAVIVLILLAVAASLVMNLRFVIGRPKRSCARCQTAGRFMKLNEKGLCRACSPEVEQEMAALGKAIRTSMQLIRKTQDTVEIGNHCAVIIEKATKALEYEKMGITFNDLNPTELIAQFTARLDSIRMEPDAVRIKNALASAHEALEPFDGITIIDIAKKAIADAENLLGNMGISARVIAFINQKGGVGKTTSTMNVGAGLARMKKKVLLIDFDPQANLTDGMGISEDDLKYNIYDFLMGKADPKKVIVDKKGISVIPAHMMLTRFEQECRDNPNRNAILREALKGAGDFDYILIDCPPTLGFLTLNALTAAQDIFIPFIPEYFALKGIRKTLHIIDYIRKTSNENLSMRGIVATRYDSEKALHQEVVDKIEKSFGDSLYQYINEDISLSEASSYGQSIFDYGPDSRGARDYSEFCRKILDGKRMAVATLTEA